MLKSAKRPLVIIGKGMAWSGAEKEVRDFIEKTGLPFLASPMGKGVMDDNHKLSVGAARSHALQEADVVVLMGARLNWIMHFGLPPRFNKDVRIVQLDISPEAISQNVPAEVALVGDGKAIVGQLNKALESFEYHYPEGTDWHKAIAEKSAANAKQIKPMIDDESAPTNYYRAFRDIAPWIPENAIIVGEGANTMDIGRTQMPNRQCAHASGCRLATAPWASAWAWCMAAAAVHPDRPIVSVSGDSAIGFSGMEMETVCRHKMKVKIVVLNNGGIGSGVAELPADLQKGGPNLLTVGCRYDKMMEAFGGKGFFVTDPKDLKAALDGAMKFNGPALVNVQLHHAAGRKPQQFKWHTSAEE